MRARLVETGWDTSLQLEPMDDAPTPTNGEVVVRVEACGVCHRDLIDRAGRFPFLQLPITPGHEVVGRVIAVGDGVTEWREGDRVATMHRDYCGDCSACETGDTSLCVRAASVLGLLRDGGYASYLAAPAAGYYAMADDIPAELAAVMHCTLGTAYRGLSGFGGVTTGMRVLVTGANGGVGAAAVQIAQRLGASVVAVVRREKHVAALEKQGAEVIVNDDGRFHKRIGGSPMDAVLDCVGAPTFNASLRSLGVGGRLIAVGNVVEERVQLNLGYIITRGIKIAGSSGATRRDMEAVLAFHAERPFELPLHASLPLSDADKAQRMVRAGGLNGRIVLVPAKA